MGIETIFIIAALIMSIVIHEIAHGYAANWLGDPTARLQGRLSLNPIVHIDPIGSVLVPALLFFGNAGFLFGWAKPVPYNPYNLNNAKWGEAIVAAAGPAVNLLIAIIFGILIRLSEVLSLNAAFLELAVYIVFINTLLALFNLIPFPPLDGSKIIKPFLPFRAARAYEQFMMQIQQYGLIIVFVLLFLLINIIWPYLFSAVVTFGGLVTGLSVFEFANFLR